MVRAIVGANWGDEGKGKITDMLAKESDIIIRFQGGCDRHFRIFNSYFRRKATNSRLEIFNNRFLHI